MGAKQTTLTPEQRRKNEKEVADSKHKKYVESVLTRKNASEELKAALLDAAETKRLLLESDSNLYHLQQQGNSMSKQSEKLEENLRTMTVLYQRQTSTFGAALIILLVILFGLYVSSLSRRETTSTDSIADVQNSGNTLPRFLSENTNGRDTEVMIISKSMIVDVFSSYGLTADDTRDAWTLLKLSKSRKKSYAQMLSLLSKELLPELTAGLVASSLGIAVVFIATLTLLLMFLPVLPAAGQATFSFLILCGLTSMGIWLGTVSEAIQIPAGILIVQAALICPLVVDSCFRFYFVPKEQFGKDSWRTFLIVFSTFFYTSIMLHVTAYAPLAVINTVTALMMLIILVHPATEGKNYFEYLSKTMRLADYLMLITASTIGWCCSFGIVALLAPQKVNLEYILVSDVQSWYEWSFMLFSFIWLLVIFILGIAPSHSNKIIDPDSGRSEYWTVSLQLCLYLYGNFILTLAVLGLPSIWSLSILSSGENIHSGPIESLIYSTPFSVFGHLSALVLGFISVTLTIDKVGHKKDKPSKRGAAVKESNLGIGEALLFMNIFIIWASTKLSNSLLLVLGIIDVATYVLCKSYQYVQGIGFLIFSVLFAVGVTAIGIMWERA